MSDAISHFLAMGGYALYIWPAYGVSAVVMGWIAIASWRRTKVNEAELKKLQDAEPASPPPRRRPGRGDLMKAKHRRLVAVVAGVAILGTRRSWPCSPCRTISCFSTSRPTCSPARSSPTSASGLAAWSRWAASSTCTGPATVDFTVTDLTNAIPVVYTGLLPDLFREGQGVVAEGKLDGDGVFHADQVLAKHDENYMPQEVADALKKKAVGQWREAAENTIRPRERRQDAR